MFRRQKPKEKDSGKTERLAAPLIEYLYVDGARLDHYFEQISGPVTFEKVPTFGGSVALTGPSVSASQTAHGREFTRYEKIVALEAHLSKGGYLGTDRPELMRSHGTEPVFRSEICKATRALIPNDQAPLALWICDPPDVQDAKGLIPGPLYLIENFRSADTDWSVIKSPYSALRMLGDSLENPALEPALRSSPDEGDPDELFSRQPFELIEKLGGKVADPRTIKVLYRVRATLRDAYRSGGTVVAIGYPIVIEEASTTRKTMG